MISRSARFQIGCLDIFLKGEKITHHLQKPEAAIRAVM